MSENYLRRSNFLLLAIIALWAIMIAASVLWNFAIYDNTAYENAKADAVSSYNKDLLYRRWVSMQGGVYVTPSEKTPPNPYLSHIPDRDLTTSTGKKLTLINPAYMTRQIHELSNKQYGTKGHITSLNPINPINKADAWEEKALKSFEKGIKEVCSVEITGDTSYLRYMKPMITEKGCLKCHEFQGYKVGDIRGGISVSVSMENYLATARVNKKNALFLHLGIFGVGLFVFLIFGFSIKRNIIERESKTEALKKSEENLKIQKDILDSIFENSPYIMIVVDANANVLNINRPGLNLTGKGKSDLVGDLTGIAINCINALKVPGCGKHPECFVCPIRTAINKTYATGISLHNEEASMTFMRNLKKISFDLLISTAPLKNEVENAVLITIADITAQKQSEKIINESKNKFESIFDLAPYAIVLTDIKDGFYVDVNNTFEKLSGYSKNEIIGKSVNEIVFWVDIKDRAVWYSQVLKEGEVSDYEYSYISRNKEIIIGHTFSKIIELGGREVILSIIQDVTERKHNEELIHRTTGELKLAQKISQVGSWVWDIAEDRLHWSDEMFNIWGIDRNNFSGKLEEIIAALIHPDDKMKVQQSNESVVKEGKPYPVEFRIIRPDGEIRTVWGEAGKLELDEQGRPVSLTGIIQDITDRKKVESELIKYEQRMSFFFRNNPLAVVEWDTEFRVKDWNIAAEEIFGYKKEEVLGKHGNIIIPGLIQENISHVWEAIIASSGGKSSTNENITKEGKIVLCNWYNTALRDLDGVLTGVISIAQDITDEVNNKEELKRSRNMIQAILDSIPQAIFWKDCESRYLGCNRIFADYIGLKSIDEIVNKTDYELPWQKQEADLYIADDRYVIKNKTPKYNIVEPVRKENGEKMWVNTSKVPIFDVDGAVYGVLGIFEDITDKKETELRQRLFVDTLNASYNELYIFDADTLKFEFVSGGALKNLGYTLEQMKEKTPLDLKPDFTLDRFQELIAPLYKKELPIIHFETRHKRADGSFYPVDVHLQLFDHEDKKVFLAVILDVTERRNADERLRQSEERFFKVFQANPAAIVIARTSDYKIIDVNESYLKLFGYRRDEVIGHDSFELGTYLNINDHFEISKHIIEKEKIPMLELKLRNKYKKILHVLASFELVEINGEQCIITLITDISERIAAENKLRSSEERHRTLFETMVQGVIYRDGDGRIMSANKAAEKILGLSIEEMVGRSLSDAEWRGIREDGSRFPIEEHPSFIALREGISVSNVTIGVFNPREKRTRWIVINSTPQFRNNEEKPYRVYSTFTDITDRKLAEEALKASETRFSSIFHISPVCMAITRMKDNRVIEVNKSWHTITGFSIEETLNKTTFELDLWADTVERDILIDNIKQYGALHDFEFKLKRRNGEELDMLMSAEKVELNGELCMLSIAQDITSRKRMEKALRESEERYKSLFDLSPDAIFVHRDGEIIMANQAAGELINIESPDMLKGKRVIELIHPDFREKVLERAKAIMEKDTIIPPFNQVYLRSDGSSVDVEVSGAPCILDGKKTFQVFARNITERLKTEKALNENREKMIAILKAIPDMMFILSDNGVFLDYHSTKEEELYLNPDDFIHKNILDVLPPEVAELTLDKIRSILESGQMQTFEYTLDMNGHRSFESRIVPCGQNSFLAIVRDVTKNKRDEIELKKSLDEKDTLLRELYHRTKNNMQVISAMLQLQTLTMSDAGLVKILIETSNRIKTMALVHQKLYQSRDLSRINLKDYIIDLISLLKALYNIDEKKIKILLDLEDQPILIDYAVPCGLIINEIISNTFKYAFPEEKTGSMMVKLFRRMNGALVLVIKDTGVGFPEDLNIDSGKTLGMKLINTLVEHQLDGTVNFRNENGALVEITFFDNQYEIRI